MRYLVVCGGKIDKEFGLNEIKTDGIDAIIALTAEWISCTKTVSRLI